MILYEDMLDDIMPELSGCSTEIAINALRNACIELYRKSWIKRIELAPIEVVIGQNEYELPLEAGSQIVGIVSAYKDEKKLDPISEDMFNRYPYDWTTQTGEITGYLQTAANLLAVYRIPDKTGIIKVTAIVAPTRDSDSIDQDVYDMYSEGIAAGAKARVMAMPKRPYTDAVASAMYRGQFTEVLSQAKWAARKSLVSSQLTVARRRVF